MRVNSRVTRLIFDVCNSIREEYFEKEFFVESDFAYEQISQEFFYERKSFSSNFIKKGCEVFLKFTSCKQKNLNLKECKERAIH